MLKYSVIGTSWITESFIEGANLVSELSLYGVYSRSAEKGESFKNKVGAKVVFKSFEELLKSDTDLVYVASPNLCHYEQCKKLLENNKNVICEKPITVTKSEFLELKSLAIKKGLVYFEAIMYMHSQYRKLFKSAVNSIGKISSAYIDFSQLSSKYKALKNGELPNIFNPKMKTGALNDLGIYCVYPVIDLFGEPLEISKNQHFLSTGADACGEAVFKYADKLVTITYSKVGQSRSFSQIMGDEGTVIIGSISKLDEIFIYDKNGNKKELVPQVEKKFLMGNEAQNAVNFINNYDEYKEFLDECHLMSEKVLGCMEKMRVNNA